MLSQHSSKLTQAGSVAIVVKVVQSACLEVEVSLVAFLSTWVDEHALNLAAARMGIRQPRLIATLPIHPAEISIT